MCCKLNGNETLGDEMGPRFQMAKIYFGIRLLRYHTTKIFMVRLLESTAFKTLAPTSLLLGCGCRQSFTSDLATPSWTSRSSTGI